LAEIYHQAIIVGSWRTGKTQVRQRSIQESLDYDNPEPAKVKGHIKTEVQVKKPTKARLIQAFHQFIDNYEFADEYRAFTHALVVWTAEPHTWKGMTVHLRSACGLNHEQIAAQVTDWLIQYPLGEYHLFIDDVSNMDASVQPTHLHQQVRLYNYLDPRLGSHLASTIVFKGSVRGRGDEGVVIYWGNGTVKSGAQDTSSGQTTRRIDSFVASAKLLGVTTVVGFAFGDDLWVLLGPKRPTEQEWYQAQLTEGWKTKGVYVETPEKSDFLACTFALDRRGEYAMFPLPGRIFAKLFWTWREGEARVRASYIHQVAEVFQERYRGFDLMEAFLAWHCQLPKGRHIKLPELMYKRQAPHGECVDWVSFFMERYELGPPPRVSEDAIKAVDPTHTALIYDPWVDAVMRYNLSDPVDRK